MKKFIIIFIATILLINIFASFPNPSSTTYKDLSQEQRYYWMVLQSIWAFSDSSQIGDTCHYFGEAFIQKINADSLYLIRGADTILFYMSDDSFYMLSDNPIAIGNDINIDGNAKGDSATFNHYNGLEDYAFKDSLDYHYSNTYTVSQTGAMFTSIQSVLDSAEILGDTNISILIYGDLVKDSVDCSISDFFANVAIMGMGGYGGVVPYLNGGKITIVNDEGYSQFEKLAGVNIQYTGGISSGIVFITDCSMDSIINNTGEQLDWEIMNSSIFVYWSGIARATSYASFTIGIESMWNNWNGLKFGCQSFTAGPVLKDFFIAHPFSTGFQFLYEPDIGSYIFTNGTDSIILDSTGNIYATGDLIADSINSRVYTNNGHTLLHDGTSWDNKANDSWNLYTIYVGNWLYTYKEMCNAYYPRGNSNIIIGYDDSGLAQKYAFIIGNNNAFTGLGADTAFAIDSIGKTFIKELKMLGMSELSEGRFKDDSVFIKNDTIISFNNGMQFIDTLGTDSLYTYIRETWLKQ